MIQHRFSDQEDGPDIVLISTCSGRFSVVYVRVHIYVPRTIPKLQISLEFSLIRAWLTVRVTLAAYVRAREERSMSGTHLYATNVAGENTTPTSVTYTAMP